MRRSVYVGALILAAVTFGNSRQQSAETQLKANSELVLVPVVVQKSGAHVGGLTKPDFTLMQDGQAQEIAVFEEVHTTAPVFQTQAGPQEFTNEKAGGNPERMTVIALDLVNTAPLDQAYLKQELLKFLESAKKTGEPYSLVAINTKGVTMLQNFTTDPSAVAAAARKVETAQIGREATGKTGNTQLDATPCAASAAGCGGDKNAEAGARDLNNWEDLYKNAEGYEIFRDRTARIDTLSALQQIAQHLRGYPGRKTLIWAGSGIQWAGGMTRMMTGGRSADYSSWNTTQVNQNLDANMHTLQLLSAANVSVYPLDARHGANTSFAVFDVTRSDAPIGDRGFSGERGRVQNDDQERITMFQQIAAATGGKPCFNRTDLANCLQEFARDSHDYYMLGYYVDKKTKPGWHPITVKLNQKADMRHRSGFIRTALDEEKVRMTDLQLAMMSPLPYTSLELYGHFGEAQTKGAKKLVPFTVNIPPKSIDLGEQGTALNLDVVAIARGTDGKEVAKFAQKISRTLQPQQAEVVRADGIKYTNKLELPSGVYGVWFVVRDNGSGRTGSVTTTLRVE